MYVCPVYTFGTILCGINLGYLQMDIVFLWIFCHGSMVYPHAYVCPFSERDSLVRLLRNSARQQSIDGDAAPSSQARYNLTSRDDDRRSRLTNLLVVSHDRTGGSSYSTTRGKEE